MKRTILTFVLVILTVFVYGQTFQFQQGKKPNKKAYVSNVIRLLPSNTEGQVFLVEPDFNVALKVKCIKASFVDMDWKASISVKLPNTQGNTIEGVFQSSEGYHIVLSNRESKLCVLRHLVLDASSLQITKDVVLHTAEIDGGKNGWYTTATSPNGQFFVAVYTCWNTKNKRVEQSQAMLYDNNMVLQWNYPTFSDGPAQQIFLSDNGSVIVSYMGYNSNSNETMVRFTAADEFGVSQGGFVTVDNIEQLSIVQYSDGKVLATALESDIQRGLMKDKLCYLGARVYVYDMANSRLVADTPHTFTDDEMRVFLNEDKEKSVGKKCVDYVQPLHQIATTNGGAVLFQRIWSVETIDSRTGMKSETVHSKGLLLLKADMSGQIEWVRGIMRNNQNAKWPSVGADMLVQDDKIFVFINESEDESDEYNPQKPAKRSKSLIITNTALAAYWFTPDGQGSKKVIAKDGKYLLGSPLYNAGKGKYYLLTSGASPKVSILQIQ